MHTLVIGGGITGLVAAWHLHRQGQSVEVWEAEAEVGGWVKTLPWEGPGGEAGYVERGPQGVLVAPGSPADQLFKALDLPVTKPGHGARWLGKGGRLRSVPLAPPALMVSDLMPLGARLRMLLEPFQAVRSAEPEESLFDFAARRLGPGAAENLLPAMIAGILAAPPQMLSVDALPKMRQWESKGSLFKGMSSGPRSEMTIPVGGMGALPRALASRLPDVKRGLRAHGLERLEDGRWRARAEGHEQVADTIILALPAPQASALLAPHAPESARALGEIPYTTVRLFHSRHTPLAPYQDGFGFLVHPPEGKGYLGSLVPSWIDPACCPSGRMQLRTFVGGAFPTEPAYHAWEGLFPALKAWVPALSDPSQVRMELAQDAIPRAEVGHRDRIRRATEGLPQGLDWLSNARLGPGVRDVIEALAESAGA